MHDAKELTPYVPNVNSLSQSNYEIMSDPVTMYFRRCANFTACIDSAHNFNGFRAALCKNYILKQFEVPNKDTLNAMHQRIKNSKIESIRKAR